MLQEGIIAPPFRLPDQNGVLRSLDEWRGKKVVLYFYSKDNTSGCTKQAQGFQERLGEFLAAGYDVIGISKDTVESHRKFADKHGLKFTLLADTDLAVQEAYDVRKEKNMYGKKVIGTVRTTYIIDEKGTIVKAIGKVTAATSATDTLCCLNDVCSLTSR
jgi:peroxiredoxin Q/BCP